MANLINVQHFEQISAPLNTKTILNNQLKIRLPTTESHIIIIGHINIKDKFTFDRIELCCRKHFMIFWLNENEFNLKKMNEKKTTLAE